MFQADRWIDVHNPATNEVLTKVPHSTLDEMNEAVAAAKVNLMFYNTKRWPKKPGTKYVVLYVLTEVYAKFLLKNYS